MMGKKPKQFAMVLCVASAAIVLFHQARLFAVAPHSTATTFDRALDSEAKDELRAFAAMEPIDTHVHVFKSDPDFTDMLGRLRLHVLDINVADTQGIYGRLVTELERSRNFVQGSQGHASLCVTFSPFEFQQRDFAAKTIAELRQEFAAGAVAVKIWKNIGMELKRPDGTYLMPDDPVFAPIYQAIAAENKTLVAHLAEPTSSWKALDPDNPDYEYYKENPEWHMYLHPDHPRKEVILAARDHLLAENPKLRVIGAHLGSMETGVDEIAKRLDRYPNFAVDTAARMEYLMIQPRDKVRNFLIKYLDRVVYGTDLEFLNDESTADALKEWQQTYARDWKFFATDQMLPYRGRQIQGLKLPEPVLRHIFHDNAVRWIPGIEPASK
jgi:predicted TIM-barrel fold metal-dependent hydrolase